MQKQEFEERIERTVTDEQYKVIEEFLKGEGYDISKSSVGRYATRTNNAMQRMEGMSLRILSMCILKSLCGIVPRMS